MEPAAAAVGWYTGNPVLLSTSAGRLTADIIAGRMAGVAAAAAGIRPTPAPAVALFIA